MFWELGVCPLPSVMKEQGNKILEFKISEDRSDLNKSDLNWSSPFAKIFVSGGDKHLWQKEINAIFTMVVWGFFFLSISRQS